MVNNISKAYKSNEAFSLNPQTKSTSKPKTTETGIPSGALNHAARISSGLEDKVEISAEARQISTSKTNYGEEKVPSEMMKSIGSNWYSSGYALALDSLNK